MHVKLANVHTKAGIT